MATETMTAPAQSGAFSSIKDDNEDFAYWEKSFGPVMRSLLKSAGSYSPEETEAQMRILYDHVLPHLGPRPSKAYTKSFITQSGSPFQPSINFSAIKPRARYCWEPIGPKGGCESDPYVIEESKRIVNSLFDAFGFDHRWKDAIVAASALTPEQVRTIRAKLPEWMAAQAPPGVTIPFPDRLPFSFVAFELKGSTAAIKAYYNLKAKEISSGVSSNDMAFKVLRNLNPALNKNSIDMVEDFLIKRPVPLAIELIGIDCVKTEDMANARVKLYVHTRNNSFNTVRDYVTLGGRLQDDRTLKGLEALRKIWHLLLQEPGIELTDDYDKPLLGDSVFYQKLYFSFELRPSKDVPEVKTYLPTWQYVRTDAETVQNYEEIFRMCGQEWGQPGRYKQIFEDAFGSVDHNRHRPVHCDASFLYSEDRGIYQTLYYSPPMLEE